MNEKLQTAMLKRELERHARKNGFSRSHSIEIASLAKPQQLDGLPVWRKIRAKVKSLAH